MFLPPCYIHQHQSVPLVIVQVILLFLWTPEMPVSGLQMSYMLAE